MSLAYLRCLSHSRRGHKTDNTVFYKSVIVGFCSGPHLSGATANAVAVDINADDDTSKTHPVAAHCVYCPGFAANFALGSLPAVLTRFAHATACERIRRRLRKMVLANFAIRTGCKR
jgi:hypothetical protein